MTLPEIIANINGIKLPENISAETQELFIKYSSKKSATKKELADLRKKMYQIEIPRIKSQLPLPSEFKKALKETQAVRTITEGIKTLENDTITLNDFDKRMSDNSFYHKRINLKLKIMYQLLLKKKTHIHLIDYMFFKRLRYVDIIYFEKVCNVNLSLFKALKNSLFL